MMRCWRHRWIYTCKSERFCRRCGAHRFLTGLFPQWEVVWNFKEHGILEEAIWWFSLSKAAQDKVAERCGLSHKSYGGSFSYDYICQMHREEHA